MSVNVFGVRAWNIFWEEEDKRRKNGETGEGEGLFERGDYFKWIGQSGEGGGTIFRRKSLIEGRLFEEIIQYEYSWTDLHDVKLLALRQEKEIKPEDCYTMHIFFSKLGVNPNV